MPELDAINSADDPKAVATGISGQPIAVPLERGKAPNLRHGEHWAQRWGRNLADLFYPPTCVLCGAAGDNGLDICAGCRADMPTLGVACARCALPLPDAVLAMDADAEGALCGGCRHRPPPFSRTHAAFRYEHPLPALVGGLKFRGRLNTLRLMGLLLAESLDQAGGERPAGIVPVPLHRNRLRQRGYDQALELARIVGRQLDLPVLGHRCERVRWTPPQAELDAKARAGNLRGAFRAMEPGTAGRLLPLRRRGIPPQPGEHLAVLDDVVTTGSTVAEVSKVLLRAGASRVDVWCLARTP